MRCSMEIPHDIYSGMGNKFHFYTTGYLFWLAAFCITSEYVHTVCLFQCLQYTLEILNRIIYYSRGSNKNWKYYSVKRNMCLYFNMETELEGDRMEAIIFSYLASWSHDSHA